MQHLDERDNGRILTEAETLDLLYEGALLSLKRGKQCIAEGDRIGRIVETKKAIGKLKCVQAAMPHHLDRSVALSLSHFHAAMFTMTQEASECESVEGLEEVIWCIRQVREAWTLNAQESKPGMIMLGGPPPMTRPPGIRRLQA